MIKRASLYLLLMVASAQIGSAQHLFTVKGLLTDTHNQPVSFANVALYTVDKQLVAGVASNVDGSFHLDNVAQGAYSLEIQFIGYETFKKPNIKVHQDLDLGTIKLKESSQMLNEVVVTGEAIQKPLEITAEGLTINPSQNLSNLGGSVLDILRNTPSVSVNAEGGISLRGSNSTNVLINGRNSSMAANLDQIPASAVKSIKVINNPGAKFDADAKGGIINIELKKGEGLGTHGNADLNYGTGNRYNGSVKLSHQTKHILGYAGYDIRRSVNDGTTTNYREIYGENAEVITQQGDIKRRELSHNIKYGIDYFFGNNQLSYEGVYSTGKDRDHEVRVSNVASASTIETTTRYNLETERGDAIDHGLIYERTFKNKDQSFKAQVSRSTSDGQEVQSVESYAILGNAEARMDRQQGITEEDRTISTAQADYIHPFNWGGKLETGYKTVVRVLDNDFNYAVFNAAESRYENDPRISNRFRYEEQVHAFYLTYAQKFEKFNFALGNRFEKAIINTKQFATEESNRQSYLNLFPSASLQYHLSKKQDVRFTYSRRIDRPGAGRLNPFPDIADSLNIRTGNPALKPEYIQSIELGYHHELAKTDLTSTVFYRHTTGIIDQILTVDENGISHRRPENLNSGFDIGLEFIAAFNLVPWWSMNISYAIFQSQIDGSNINSDFTNDNIAWNTKLVSDFSLPHAIKLQLTGNYASAEVEAQGEDFARYYADASIMKAFKDDKIKVSLSFRDIFNTWRFGGTSYDEQFYQRLKNKPESRLIFLNVGFKI